MTTSSLILNALVCFAIAAVRARSSQNFRRVSAETATKPSVPRALASRTTSEVARAISDVVWLVNARDLVLVLAGDVADEHHLRPRRPPRLGRVADRLQVALVQMLEPREKRVRMPVEIRLDLDDRRHRVADLAEELEAHRAH